MSYHNPEVDPLIDEASTSMDEGTRLARYKRVGRLLLDDVAVIPLYQAIDLYRVSRRLDWRPGPDEAIRADEMAFVHGR